MYCILTALKAESLPIIEHLNLKKDSRFSFPVFHNNNYWLIGIGVGKKKIRHRLNTFWSLESKTTPHWINIGIAGGNRNDTTIGTLYVVNQIVDNNSGELFSINPVINHGLINQSLTTVESPISNGRDTYRGLVDMEALEVYQCCQEISKSHSISFLKIVSDWMGSDVKDLTTEKISSFVKSNLSIIVEYLDRLNNENHQDL